MEGGITHLKSRGHRSHDFKRDARLDLFLFSRGGKDSLKTTRAGEYLANEEGARTELQNTPLPRGIIGAKEVLAVPHH